MTAVWPRSARKVLQKATADADAVTVVDVERQPTEWIAPLAGALTAAGVAAAVAVVVGAPGWLAVVAATAGAGLLALVLVTIGRAHRAESAAHKADLRARRLKNDLRIERDARENAEARLAWRSRLGTLRRSSDADLLTDPETGLLLEAWLVIAAESRIASGRRRLNPVAVVMLEVVEGLGLGDPAPADPAAMAEAMLGTLRESDGAFRLQEGGFALLLEDTDDMGALLVTGRIGDAVASVSADAVVRAGVACYPAHGLTTQAVLARADEALEQARRWRQHRVEVAPAEH
jgi:two-component system cell cycle response regulator